MTINSPLDAKRLGIATVYQDLALCDNLDVVANLFLGAGEARGRAAGRGARDRRDRDGAARGRAARLAVGARRCAASARRSARSPAGSASRSRSPARCSATRRSCSSTSRPRRSASRRRGRCSTWSVRLRERGLGVILISHNIVDVFEVADRIVVLRLGRRVATLQDQRDDARRDRRRDHGSTRMSTTDTPPPDEPTPRRRTGPAARVSNRKPTSRTLRARAPRARWPRASRSSARCASRSSWR